jgi:Caspase domain
MVYRALLIGNSNFAADASLNPLNAPTKDVARLHRALVDAESGLFDDQYVRLVTERTWAELVDELDRFFAAGQKDDLLLLYYSGHGMLDERNRLYLCARDTRSDRLLSTAVSNTRINEFIDQSAARCIVIVLDCCSSGMFKGGDVAQLLSGPGRYIVSSTRGSALANDAATPTGTSLFTEHLVVGLLGEAQDRNGDGFVDLREIYEYVKSRLTSTSKQVPHCRFDGDAAVTLARRRPPAIAKATPLSSQRPREPTFALSENVITLRDVDPDERLQPEVVEIYPLRDVEIDCFAETEADWLRTQVMQHQLIVYLDPREGPNRAKIMVRDRRSGAAQVLRVEAYVKRLTVAPASTSERHRKGTPPASLPESPTVESTGPRPSSTPQSPRDELQAPAASPPPGPHASPARQADQTRQRQQQQRDPQRPPSSQRAAAPLGSWRKQTGTQHQGPSGQPPSPAPTNPTAVRALVTAIIAILLSWLIIGGLIAIVPLVLAARAAKETKADDPTSTQSKITTARALAWIAVGISIVVLFAALFS